MKQLLILISLSCFVSMANAQTKQKSQGIRVTTHATFDNMGAFINHNLRYPEDAFESGIEGTILVRFLVDEKGITHDPEVIKDPMGCKSCEVEAKRVIKAMPPWKPATYKNKTVSEVKVLPIEFKLDR